MCGLFGWQWAENNVPPKHKRLLLAFSLAQANDERGGLSWGWWGRRHRGSSIARGLGKMQFSDAFEGMASKNILMGHTRYPTRGEVTIENAHPYEIGSIIGAHNGTITNAREMDEKYPSRSAAVDSMHIIHHLNEGLALDELHGWGTVEWLDVRRPDYLNLCRLSSSAVLSVFKTPHGVVWSSLRDDLIRALKHAGLEPGDEMEIEHGQVYGVHAGKLWVLDEKQKLSEPIVRSFRPQSGRMFDYAYSWSSGPEELTDGQVCMLFDAEPKKDEEVEVELLSEEPSDQPVEWKAGMIVSREELRDAFCWLCRHGFADNWRTHEIASDMTEYCTAPTPGEIQEYEAQVANNPTCVVGLERTTFGFAVFVRPASG